VWLLQFKTKGSVVPVGPFQLWQLLKAPIWLQGNQIWSYQNSKYWTAHGTTATMVAMEDSWLLHSNMSKTKASIVLQITLIADLFRLANLFLERSGHFQAIKKEVLVIYFWMAYNQGQSQLPLTELLYTTTNLAFWLSVEVNLAVALLLWE